jgi:hypothetical protein
MTYIQTEHIEGWRCEGRAAQIPFLKRVNPSSIAAKESTGGAIHKGGVEKKPVFTGNSPRRTNGEETRGDIESVGT